MDTVVTATPSQRKGGAQSTEASGKKCTPTTAQIQTGTNLAGRAQSN